MSTLEPDTPHSAPTLSAVAKLAGVSSITVSRVVRLPDLVAPETRVRVEAAMRELGYVPNQLAGALARHLAAQGRGSLAFIGGDDPRATRRWLGFSDTLAKLGAKEPRRLILDRNASGSVVALADLPGVDAVFAANDAHAIGFMSGLRKAGLLRDGPAAEQPVAVIGLGDLEMGRLIAPSLSTIRVHGDAIGRTAARLMLSQDGPRRVDLGFELVLRDSG